MVLSDRSIRARIRANDLTIEPLIENNVEAASVDLHLGNEFIRFAHHIPSEGPIDTHGDDVDRRTDWGKKDEITISPGDFVLGTTEEHIELPDDLAANVFGRSSLGRLGIEIHKTAGFIDPGFKGEITLEMVNDNPNPVKLHSGDRVAQIVFWELDQPAKRPYGHARSQYQGQSGATQSGMKFD